MKSKYINKWLCSCGKEMILDDINYNFKGNQDEYWMCECGCSSVIKIRYGKPYKVDVYDENGDEVQYYVIEEENVND